MTVRTEPGYRLRPTTTTILIVLPHAGRARGQGSRRADWRRGTVRSSRPASGRGDEVRLRLVTDRHRAAKRTLIEDDDEGAGTRSGCAASRRRERRAAQAATEACPHRRVQSRRQAG